MAATVLGLLLQLVEGGEGIATCPHLRYLARHQQADGSWGTPPPGCRCPGEPAPERVAPEEFAPLLRGLEDDDPETRDRAEARIRALGEAALPHLRSALGHADAEVRGRCARLEKALTLSARGGSDAELTGLALMTFLGAGYSHLSKDRYDDRCFGTVVKGGLRWLIERQKRDGAFDAKDPVADTIATFALSDAYGLTGSALFKEDAQRAVDRMAARAPGGIRERIWRGMALKSAEICGLEVMRDAGKENLEGFGERADDRAIAGGAILSILVNKSRKDPGLELLRKLQPEAQDPETFYFSTLAAFQYDGPKGSLWNSWNAAMKERLLPIQRAEKDDCRRGSWDGRGFRGRLQATALHGMDFQIYYR